MCQIPRVSIEVALHHVLLAVVGQKIPNYRSEVLNHRCELTVFLAHLHKCLGVLVNGSGFLSCIKTRHGFFLFDALSFSILIARTFFIIRRSVALSAALSVVLAIAENNLSCADCQHEFLSSFRLSAATFVAGFSAKGTQTPETRSLNGSA